MRPGQICFFQSRNTARVSSCTLAPVSKHDRSSFLLNVMHERGSMEPVFVHNCCNSMHDHYYCLCSSGSFVSPRHSKPSFPRFPPCCFPTRSHVVLPPMTSWIDWSTAVFAADQQAFQHAVRQRDLLGLSCILSHGFGLSPALIEGLVESCGPRCVQDCFMEAVASARCGASTPFFVVLYELCPHAAVWKIRTSKYHTAATLQGSLSTAVLGQMLVNSSASTPSTPKGLSDPP